MSSKKAFLILFVIVLVFSLFGCLFPLGDTSENTLSDAALINISIKGVSASLGTPDAVLGKETAGLVNIFDNNNGPTKGTPASPQKAAVTKIVRFNANEEFSYISEFTSDSRAAYDNEDVRNGDFFVFQVTARDGKQLYYRVTVKKGNAHSLYTLDGSNVENENNIKNVRFFVHNGNGINLNEYDTAASYDDILDVFGNPVLYMLGVYQDLYLYAFEFTGNGSGTLVKSGMSDNPLSGTNNDETVVVDLTNAPLPPPPVFDPANPDREDPILYDQLDDYLDDVTGDTSQDPVTIKLDAITFTNRSSPGSGVKGWGELNALIETAGKYVILDLSNCTASGGAIFGNPSPGSNDMNVIQSNAYLKGLILPSGLETVFDSAFADCVHLTGITIPDSVNYIETRAFSGCTGLTEVVIPDGVETIGSYAFSGCSGLTSVTIPKSVGTIGENAFPEGSGGDGGNALRTEFEKSGAGKYTRNAGGSAWRKS